MKPLILSTLALCVFAGCQAVDRSTAAASRPPIAASAAVADPYWPADGVFPVPGRTSSWTGFRARNRERRAEFAAHRAQDQRGIVFVGDSITEGWRMLDQDFAVLGVKVVNRGISGDTTPNLIYRLEDDIMSLQPRGLVILIGTNDLGEHTTPPQIASNLGELHARIRAADPTIPIAWCLVMPRGGGDTYPERIRDLNARIAQMAAADPRVTVCDTFTPLALPDGTSNPDLYLPDRLHLISGGYAAWRTALLPVLSSWQLKP
jgi:lysophospholipase L1-like esterase